MKKILIAFGTRPEGIKMAPLIKELEKYPDEFEVKVCVTGQHKEMLDQVLNLFDIKPDYDLAVMKQGQDLYDITAKVLLGMRVVLEDAMPDLVMVHGDTTTSTSVALAAFYKQIPVGHVEAGLRTFNIYSPWPEEMNRSLTGRISTLHFSPTETSRLNLINEGVNKENIFTVGNSVIDSLLWVTDKINSEVELEGKLNKELKSKGFDLVNLKSRKIVLITGHRRENFGQGFLNICEAILSLAKQHREVDFVYPVHLNPNVQKPVNEILERDKLSNVYIIEPLDYLPFVHLMSSSWIILTDSGGIQEEAPSLGKPVLVMRDTTERPEAVHAGTVKIVGTEKDSIIREVSTLLNDQSEYNKMMGARNPYGNGDSCSQIRIILTQIPDFKAIKNVN